MTANVVRTVLLDILLPIAAYFGLVSCGLTPAWALAASAGIAAVALGARWIRSRELSTLGLLVLVRFVLGLLVALLTGDARFVLVKDYLVTFVIALAALGTLGLDRPFIARIRRDLSPDPARFDERWSRDPPGCGSSGWSARWPSPWRSSTRRRWRWRWSSPAFSLRRSCSPSLP
jgi:hypothetical protein